MERKAYTISVPSEQYVREADYFGIASGRDVDKFKETGLTAVRSELVDAPYVGEFPMVLECRLIHHHKIGKHTQFVGEILDVKIDEAVLTEEGRPDVGKIGPIVYGTGVSSYFGVGGFIGRAFEIGKKR
jgi:flavin reductase (DIM6/NTAB) family NADH-FMN oxidoreductase RutF